VLSTCLLLICLKDRRFFFHLRNSDDIYYFLIRRVLSLSPAQFFFPYLKMKTWLWNVADVSTPAIPSGKPNSGPYPSFSDPTDPLSPAPLPWTPPVRARFPPRLTCVFPDFTESPTPCFGFSFFAFFFGRPDRGEP